MSSVTGSIGDYGGSIESAYKDASATHKEVADKYLQDYYKPVADWQIALAGLVGAYGLIKQYGISKEYLNLAKDQLAQADRLIELSERNYNEVALKAFDLNKGLFDRYKNDFANYENRYLQDAFEDDEYQPDYALAQGRAIPAVSKAFDRARKNRLRQLGPNQRGLACYEGLIMSIEQARATATVVDRAYRFEEAKAFRNDQWYWQKKTQGAAYVGDMAGRVVSGVNGGAGVALSGLGAVSSAVGGRGAALNAVGEAYANLGNFYGSLAQTGFGYASFGIGRNTAAPFGAGLFGGGGLSTVPGQATATPSVANVTTISAPTTTGGIAEYGGGQGLLGTAYVGGSGGGAGPQALYGQGGGYPAFGWVPGVSEARVVNGQSVPPS